MFTLKGLMYLLLIDLILLVACTPTAAPTPPDPAAGVPFDFSGVHLRLRNATDQTFDNLELVVAGETRQIGSLAPGETSTYHTFAAVQQAPAVLATTAGRRYEWPAGVAGGAAYLAGGEFTLELALANGVLQVTVLMDNPGLQDAQQYAREMGVPLAEAVSRLQWQSRVDVGDLENALQAHEKETFAGLWLQHEPAFRIVVAFTERGGETIRRYVAADSELAQLIEVRPARYTLERLLADQESAHQILRQAALQASSGVNLMENRVEVYVTDTAGLAAALAAVNATFPESVIVTAVYEPVGDTPPFSITPVPDVFMAQLKVRDAFFMGALLTAELVVENGCLQAQTEHGLHLIIWQADYFLTQRDGRIHVLDEKGDVVATVGETFSMGGGEIPAVAEVELRAPIPEACAGGPHWRMGAPVLNRD
jgi:hypothetical protein